jgi:hypothetical protein
MMRGGPALDEFNKLFPRIPIKWTLEACKADAKKYSARTEWQKMSQSAYGIAHRAGWLDECCSHMTLIQRPNGYWTKENCKTDAKKYSGRWEWQKMSKGAYLAAQKNGWLDECMTLIHRPNGYWTLEACITDAKKYSARTEWQKKSGGAYRAAQENGWLDECCAHMKKKVAAGVVSSWCA